MADSTATLSSIFRAKVQRMKSWKPENSPSNRDRLELYALHKQAVSGDAPLNPPAVGVSSSSSVGDKAKFNAWKGKRGLGQEEAMNQYISECDRQIRVYGTAPEVANKSRTDTHPTTPTNTPAANSNTSAEERSTSVLLTPRGLAAVPLLCAAASETRVAYLARIKATSPTDGWWARQEALCADPDSVFATPESVVIKVAAIIEKISLSVGSTPFPFPASVLQAFLWPLHNVLLAVWIMLIFVCTLVGSSVLVLRTILFGAKSTHVPLESSFSEEVIPSSKAASSLCESHQAISVRLLGLALVPLVITCDACIWVDESLGILLASFFYVAILALTWWYWFIVLPWLACGGLFLSIGAGWAFALIELARVCVPEFK